MAEKNLQWQHRDWITILAPTILLFVIGMAVLGFYLHGSASARASAEKAKGGEKASSLPADLSECADARYASLDSLASGSREAQERQRRTVQQLGLPLEVKTRKTGIVFRLIPPGSFTMGIPQTEQDAMVRAGVPRKLIEGLIEHQVNLSKAFYCAKFEVTQGQWEQVMESNPSHFANAGKDAPVEWVSWDNCQAFVKKLCQMEGVSEGTYRLLTEAQWEYACRSGTTTAFCYGNDLDSRMANFNGEYPCGNGRKGPSRQTTMAVGSFRANAWGLYDMHGNVSEWCHDWYVTYESGVVTDPLGYPRGRSRVNRGGGWNDYAWQCGSAVGNGYPPSHVVADVGLRLARTIPPTAPSVFAAPVVTPPASESGK